MLSKFTYIKAKTLEEAVNYLAKEENASIISGGTDLLVQVRNKINKPNTIIDVKEIPDLAQIIETPEEVFIGGAVTFSEIIDSDIISTRFLLLKQAAQKVGSPQIRNIGTIAGNVQTASPAGDGLLAMFGLEAKIELISTKGERKVLIEDFIIGPKKTCRRPDELIKGFRIPKNSYDYQKFFKIGKRNALAISIVNGVIGLKFDKSKSISDALIVLGSVAPTPIRLKEAEKILKGKKYNDKLGLDLRQEITSALSPITDIRASKEYRKYIAGVMCNRIIKTALK